MLNLGMRRLLDIKEYAIFYSVLTDFIVWADTSDKEDLTDMLPSGNQECLEFL